MPRRLPLAPKRLRLGQPGGVSSSLKGTAPVGCSLNPLIHRENPNTQICVRIFSSHWPFPGHCYHTGKQTPIGPAAVLSLPVRRNDLWLLRTILLGRPRSSLALPELERVIVQVTAGHGACQPQPAVGVTGWEQALTRGPGSTPLPVATASWHSALGHVGASSCDTDRSLLCSAGASCGKAGKVRKHTAGLQTRGALGPYRPEDRVRFQLGLCSQPGGLSPRPCFPSTWHALEDNRREQ